MLERWFVRFRSRELSSKYAKGGGGLKRIISEGDILHIGSIEMAEQDGRLNRTERQNRTRRLDRKRRLNRTRRLNKHRC